MTEQVKMEAKALEAAQAVIRRAANGNFGDTDSLTKVMLTEYLSTAQPVTAGVKVLPLEWSNNEALTPFGTIYVIHDVTGFLSSPRFDLWLRSSEEDDEGVFVDGGFEHWSGAAVCAQAHHDARIRSSLVPVASEPVAWRYRMPNMDGAHWMIVQGPWPTGWDDAWERQPLYANPPAPSQAGEGAKS